MVELLRTYQQVTNALLRAVMMVVLCERVKMTAIEDLQRIRERCNSLANIDPPLQLLLGAIDQWFTDLKQFRATGVARQRGGALKLPPHANERLSAATQAFCLMIAPDADTRARRRARRLDEEDAERYREERTADDDIPWK